MRYRALRRTAGFAFLLFVLLSLFRAQVRAPDPSSLTPEQLYIALEAERALSPPMWPAAMQVLHNIVIATAVQA